MPLLAHEDMAVCNPDTETAFISMKFPRKILGVIGMMMIVSAIIGVQHLEWSSGRGFSYRLATPISRAISLFLGIFLLFIPLEIRKGSSLGLRITMGLFYLAIAQVLWQGCDFAIKSSTSTFDVVWALGSQFAVAIILYVVMRRVRKRWIEKSRNIESVGADSKPLKVDG